MLALNKSMDDLGLSAGREFEIAVKKARSNATPILLADRDVDETLRRLSAAIQQTSSQAVHKSNFAALLATHG